MTLEEAAKVLGITLEEARARKRQAHMNAIAREAIAFVNDEEHTLLSAVHDLKEFDNVTT